MNGAQPSAGNMFELDAIAACLLRGADDWWLTSSVPYRRAFTTVAAFIGMQLAGALSTEAAHEK